MPVVYSLPKESKHQMLALLNRMWGTRLIAVFEPTYVEFSDVFERQEPPRLVFNPTTVITELQWDIIKRHNLTVWHGHTNLSQEDKEMLDELSYQDWENAFDRVVMQPLDATIKKLQDRISQLENQKQDEH